MELTSKNVKKIILIMVISILVFLGVQNFDIVMNLVGIFFTLIKPFLIGLFIAFSLNVIMKPLEERAFSPLNKMNIPLWNRARRGISILLSYSIVIGVSFVLFFLVVPELGKSFHILVNNIHVYSEFFQSISDKLIKSLNISQEYAESIQIDWNKIFSIIGNSLMTISNDFINATVNITSFIVSWTVNIIIGVAFSVYMLVNKEKLSNQAKRICIAYLSKRRAEYIISVGKLSNKMFSRFILGQLTEAVVIGVLCFIGMSIFSMPYALLISTIVGFTSIIPVFGAFFGTAVGVFIIAMIEPITAFWFVVFIIVLQQIEENLIYPRVVGNSIGLPGIWVLFAVTVGGNAFGIMGMIIGIPLSAILYCLLKNDVRDRLRNKRISDTYVEEVGVDLTKRP